MVLALSINSDIGLPGAAYYCGETYSCDMLPGTAGGFGNIACCDDTICGVRNTCVDYNDYFSSSACDNGCEKDTYTVKWYVPPLAFAFPL